MLASGALTKPPNSALGVEDNHEASGAADYSCEDGAWSIGSRLEALTGPLSIMLYHGGR
jgi:hypothetical protein